MAGVLVDLIERNAGNFNIGNGECGRIGVMRADLGIQTGQAN